MRLTNSKKTQTTKLTQVEISNPNRFISCKNIELKKKKKTHNTLIKKRPDSDGINAPFYQTLKE